MGMSESITISTFFDDAMLLALAQQDADLQTFRPGFWWGLAKLLPCNKEPVKPHCGMGRMQGLWEEPTQSRIGFATL